MEVDIDLHCKTLIRIGLIPKLFSLLRMKEMNTEEVTLF